MSQIQSSCKYLVFFWEIPICTFVALGNPIFLWILTFLMVGRCCIRLSSLWVGCPWLINKWFNIQAMLLWGVLHKTLFAVKTSSSGFEITTTTGFDLYTHARTHARTHAHTHTLRPLAGLYCPQPTPTHWATI